MKRPTKCLLCNEQMYYVDHAKHEPEYTIEVQESHKYIGSMHVHQRCFRAWLKQIKGITMKKKAIKKKKKVVCTVCNDEGQLVFVTHGNEKEKTIIPCDCNVKERK